MVVTSEHGNKCLEVLSGVTSNSVIVTRLTVSNAGFSPMPIGTKTRNIEVSTHCGFNSVVWFISLTGTGILQ